MKIEELEKCEICPRKCKVNRLKGEKGFCNLGSERVFNSSIRRKTI